MGWTLKETAEQLSASQLEELVSHWLVAKAIRYMDAHPGKFSPDDLGDVAPTMLAVYDIRFDRWCERFAEDKMKESA